MKYLKGAFDLIIGMFVSDWTQTLGILVILAAGWLVIHNLHSTLTAIAMVVVLGAHLVYTTVSEAGRRQQT